MRVLVMTNFFWLLRILRQGWAFSQDKSSHWLIFSRAEECVWERGGSQPAARGGVVAVPRQCRISVLPELMLLAWGCTKKLWGLLGGSGASALSTVSPPLQPPWPICTPRNSVSVPGTKIPMNIENSNSSLNPSCLSQHAFPHWKILQGQWRQFKVWVSQGRTEWLFSFFRVFSYSQAKLSSCLFQLSCWIRDLCQLSALFNLGQQDTKPKWQIVLCQTLLSSSIYPMPCFIPPKPCILLPVAAISQQQWKSCVGSMPVVC